METKITKKNLSLNKKWGIQQDFHVAFTNPNSLFMLLCHQYALDSAEVF